MMHPLLKRQLKKLGLANLTELPTRETWERLLVRVSQSYTESDQGRSLLERSLQLSSTEMRQLNEELRLTSATELTKERDRLQAIIRSLGAGVCALDATGRVQIMNQVAERLFGTEKQQLVGRRLFDLLHVWDAQMLAPLIALEDFQRRIAAGEPIESRDAWFQVEGHGSFPVSFVLNPILHDGALVGSVLVFQDITEGKRQQEEISRTNRFLDSLIESLPIMVFVKDAATLRMIHWNRAAEKLTGIPRDEILGKTDHDLFPRDQADVFASKDRAVLADRSLLDIPEEPIVTRHRGTRLFHTMKYPVCDDHGRPQYLLGVSEDITERKQAEADLTRAKEAAEAANRAKSQFLANMSHEIRTPMNGVLGMAELLLTTPLKDQQYRYAETVLTSGRNLVTVLNDVLDFAKIEAGKLTLESVEFDLRETMEDVISLYAKSAHAKGLELLCDIAEEMPLIVKGDPHRLSQVLTNLISNAIKFTERGDIVVSAAAQTSSADRLSFRFEVRDTGIGIAHEVQGKIFEAFSQADNSTTRKYGGTGLGLTIVTQLVHMMGGRIGLESQVGHGSRFWFTITLHSGNAQAPIDPYPPQLADLRALIVDDNATNRRLLAQRLRKFGMQVDDVPDAEQALHALRSAILPQHAYRVALLDQHLPGVDGLTVARTITRETTFAGTRLLMLCSGGLDLDAAKAAGIEMVLNKPVRHKDLLHALAQVVTPAPSAPRIPVPFQSPSQGTASGVRVLVVEDNSVNREVAKASLEFLGHHVDIAENGRQAVDATAHALYDLVFMDCQMPTMDGFEATKCIRKREAANVGAQQRAPRLPIVALTAHALAGDREQCLAAGMDDYLAKPFTQEQLRTIVSRWLKTEVTASLTARAASRDLARKAAIPARTDPVPSTRVAADRQTPVAAGTVDRKIWDQICAIQQPGRPDILARLLEMFLQDSEAQVASIRQAVETQNADALAHAAHSLKGKSGALGATRLMALCKDLESCGRTRTMETTREKWSALEVEFGAVCAVFRKELAKRRP